ncbi:MAG: restriction endonuclease [Defluviitaleaceae bacterium]|nr:restriction endonuclease [Defluviitaleaceae bacterium]
MSRKNTGRELENYVYLAIKDLIMQRKFMVEFPHVSIKQQKKYYSKDRDDYITTDISVEKYLENPEANPNINPSLIIIIECKDYKTSIPVDDVEEFHAKLQQIGAHKGMIFTRHGSFQKSALSYAKSKGIGLARIMPDEQVKQTEFIMHMMYDLSMSMSFDVKSTVNELLNALTNTMHTSSKHFFSLDGFNDLDDYIESCLEL